VLKKQAPHKIARAREMSNVAFHSTTWGCRRALMKSVARARRQSDQHAVQGHARASGTCHWRRLPLQATTTKRQ